MIHNQQVFEAHARGDPGVYTYGVVGEGFQIVAFPAMKDRAKFQKKTCGA